MSGKPNCNGIVLDSRGEIMKLESSNQILISSEEYGTF